MANSNFSYAYASNHDECNYYSDKYLQINNCGALRVNKPAGGSSHRPPRVDFLMMYLHEGIGWGEPHGYREEIHAGEIIVLKPGTPLNFGFKNNSMHFWIHFTGSAAEQILLECGIKESGIYNIGVSNEYWENLTDIYLQHSFGSNGAMLRANGLLMNFFGDLAEILNPGQNVKEIVREKKIYPALKDMNINFDKNRKLEYYAQLCGISLSNFQHAFTKITGVTPQKYLISIRIENAKKMLLSLKLPIKNVASAVGYDDQLYFSRIFKKYTGYTPREYARRTDQKDI